jgi:hypothetical protein
VTGPLPTRGWAGAALAAVLVVLVALASPASARIAEGPESGEVVGQHAELRITSSSAVATLEVVDPAGTVLPATERTEGDNRPTILLKTRCPFDPGAECAGGPVGANGQWTIRSGRFDPEPEERPFFLRIGGVPVTDVKVAVSERVVTVSWTPGPEADVTGWSVSDGKDQSQRVGPGACTDGVCAATFEYPPTASGERTFAVRAARASGVEGESDPLGPPAGSEPVTLPPAASASPGESGPPSGDAGSAPPASGGSGRAPLPQGFGTFEPKLGLPKVPPMPGGQAPSVAQLPDTFDETLSYGERPDVAPEVELEQVPRAEGREGTTLISTGGLLGDEQVMRGIAGALVLVLSGAHLRTWLARAREESLEI